MSQRWYDVLNPLILKELYLFSQKWNFQIVSLHFVSQIRVLHLSCHSQAVNRQSLSGEPGQRRSFRGHRQTEKSFQNYGTLFDSQRISPCQWASWGRILQDIMCQYFCPQDSFLKLCELMLHQGHVRIHSWSVFSNPGLCLKLFPEHWSHMVFLSLGTLRLVSWSSPWGHQDARWPGQAWCPSHRVASSRRSSSLKWQVSLRISLRRRIVLETTDDGHPSRYFTS